MAIEDFGVCLEAEKGQKTFKDLKLKIFYANKSTSDVEIVEKSVIMLTEKKRTAKKTVSTPFFISARFQTN